MFNKIKDYLIEFLVIVLVLGGLLYSVTENYKTSLKVQDLEKIIKKNEEKINSIRSDIAVQKLNNGLLTNDDIKDLATQKDIATDKPTELKKYFKPFSSDN